MTSDMRGRIPGPERFITDAVQALQYLEAAGCQRPVLMPSNPVARINTYTALMYSALWEHGVAPLPLIRIGDLNALIPLLQGQHVPCVLHQQWTSTILAGSTSVAAAERRAQEYFRLIDRFQQAGGRLVWTVHNVLPHDAPFPDVEAAIHQELANRAQAIHVLNTATIEASADFFRIPADKTVHIPHPHYMGSYPDIITRDQARWDLHLQPDEVVYSFLGAIKPYKGLEQLLDAFDTVSKDGRPRRLVVAGNPSADPATQAVLDRCQLHPNVVLRAGTVPDNELQYYLRAADVAVLPYQQSLNSGVLMLALSFGLPVVAPATPATRDIVTPAVARTFQPGDAGSLAAALAAADELVTPAARAQATQIARSYDPAGIAGQFAGLVCKVVAA